MSKHYSITLDVPIGLGLCIYAIANNDWIALVVGIFFMQGEVTYKPFIVREDDTSNDKKGK